MGMVRVRYAPSPTGNPHVGNIRTALFTYLFARRHKGKFLVRIEDTDKKREVEESYTTITDSLKWLGLTFDEQPVRQSNRLTFYKEHAQQLLQSNRAYHQEGAIYFKISNEGKTSWTDLIGNKLISFKNDAQKDFVILKSDGFPTYHLASVVDDHLFEITHVTRGEDWISSTPKHIMLYEAFGWKQPEFAHFPNILATDRSKLSKRHGAIGVLDFKKDGILPQALVNYLALLGWTPPSGKEILSLSEMIEEFDLKDINIAPAIFDITKLEWTNGEYIRKLSDRELEEKLDEYLVDHPARGKLTPLIPLVKERIKKLSDFIPLTYFFFEQPDYDIEVFKKLKIDNLKEALGQVLEKLQKMEKPWKTEGFEQTFRKMAQKLGLSASQMFQLIRVVISGQLVTPPLFESIQILGEEETIKRAARVLQIL